MIHPSINYQVNYGATEQTLNYQTIRQVMWTAAHWYY